MLEKQARLAAEVIGCSSLRFLGLPDQRLDAIPLIELTQQLEAALDDIDPHVVYTHFPGDVNTDHGLVARAAWTACRPFSRPQLCRFAVFETPSSTEWAWPLPGGQLEPNLFVNVTETLDIKVAAMECYETELRDYPHPRSSRALRERAAFWGSHIGRLQPSRSGCFGTSSEQKCWPQAYAKVFRARSLAVPGGGTGGAHCRDPCRGRRVHGGQGRHIGGWHFLGCPARGRCERQSVRRWRPPGPSAIHIPD